MLALIYKEFLQTNRKITMTPKVYALPHLEVTLLFLRAYCSLCPESPSFAFFSLFKGQLKCHFFRGDFRSLSHPL